MYYLLYLVLVMYMLSKLSFQSDPFKFIEMLSMYPHTHHDEIDQRKRKEKIDAALKINLENFSTKQMNVLCYFVLAGLDGVFSFLVHFDDHFSDK